MRSKVWKSFLFWLLILIAMVPTSASATVVDKGQSGPITREDLRAGLRELVTDESIDVANSAAFDEARLIWNSDDEFVAQIDYQLDYRSRVDFLPLDGGHIAQLLVDRPSNFGIESLGLYLSDDEVAEMGRRAQLGDRMEQMVTSITGVDQDNLAEHEDLPDYGPIFGGIMQDQLDGGIIVLGVTNASLINTVELESLAGGAENLQILEQEFSYNEIESYRQVLEAELEQLGIPGDITAVWTSIGLSLEVRVEDPSALPASFGSGVPEGAFVVVAGETMHDAGAPNTLHSFADQQPGLRVQVAITDGDDEICTWGHNGHTPGYHYIVTAGHCFSNHQNTSGVWMGETVNLWQDGISSRDVTPGNSYLVSIKSSSYDMARIESSYANDNCYHATASGVTGHCQYKMQSTAQSNSWEVGSDQTCASLGNSGVFRCGYVTELNHGTDHTIAVGMTTAGGDSGSGMMWVSNRIDGILNGYVSGTSFFQEAFRVRNGLGFDFNCHVGLLQTTDPSDWAPCPFVNA